MLKIGGDDVQNRLGKVTKRNLDKLRKALALPTLSPPAAVRISCLIILQSLYPPVFSQVYKRLNLAIRLRNTAGLANRHAACFNEIANYFSLLRPTLYFFPRFLLKTGASYLTLHASSLTDYFNLLANLSV